MKNTHPDIKDIELMFMPHNEVIQKPEVDISEAGSLV